jgi:PAS domain S-box-containing protein
VIEFFSREIRNPDERLLAIARIIGGQLGQFIERKRTEENLAEAARVQQALYAFVERRHRAESLTEIYDSALEGILAALRCQRASILLFDDSGVMRFVASKGLSREYCQAVEGHSPWKINQRNPEPLCIDDIEKAAMSDSLKETVKREGIRALAFVPLVSSDELMGKFMAYFDEPHRFSGGEVELSLTIARQLASGIERNRAENAVRANERRFRQMIDVLPFAIYTTDAEGRITHFNPAAVELSGRTPELNSDQWCVSWKLYRPDGAPLPHNECPMAVALKTGRSIRGEEIIAERPEGKRIRVTPYPTPLRDAEGRIIGGINMLVDITEHREAETARVLLGAIVDSSDDAIISKNLNGIIMSWNKSAERLFGYTAAEAIGQSITMLIPADRQNEEPQILERLKRGERVDHYETVRVCKDGSTREISLTISPVKDADGRVVGASKIARDITERKRSEAALRASQQHLELISNAVPALISYIDHDRRYRTCNRAYTDWFGMPAENIVGKPAREVLGEEAWAVLEPRIDSAFAGETVEFESEVNYRSVGRRWIHAVYTPDRDAQGRVMGLVVMVNDMTDRKKADEALREAHTLLADKAKHLETLVQERTAKLKETVTELETFSYSVSHDLRSPLRAMQAYAGIVAESAASKLSSQETEYLRRINRAALRLDRLTQDVLAYSRVARDAISLQPVNLEKLIYDVIDQYPQIQEHRSHIVIQSPLLVVLAHESSLAQSVSNLLSNALKFVPSGVSPKIHVWTENARLDSHPAAKLVVQDNGIGIAPEHADRIFQMFGRVHSDKAYPGTGIGLTIVKKAIERMGGMVGYESHVGKGSRFWMVLKRA